MADKRQLDNEVTDDGRRTTDGLTDNNRHKRQAAGRSQFHGAKRHATAATVQRRDFEISRFRDFEILDFPIFHFPIFPIQKLENSKTQFFNSSILRFFDSSISNLNLSTTTIPTTPHHNFIHNHKNQKNQTPKMRKCKNSKMQKFKIFHSAFTISHFNISTFQQNVKVKSEK